MAQGTTKNTRMSEHPLITGEFNLPHVNVVTGFYKTRDGASVFVDKKYEDRVRLYYKTGSVVYTTTDKFVQMKLTPETNKDSIECHVRINDQTVAVAFSYYHARVIYEAFITEYLVRLPYPSQGFVKTSFEIYASAWGKVKAEDLMMRSGGKHERLPYNIKITKRKEK